MRTSILIVILALSSGCVSSRHLTYNEMSQRLSTAGVDYFDYTVTTNEVYSLTLESGTVDDVSALTDVRLTALDIATTCISDLSPLRSMRLSKLSFDPNLATNGVDVIRSMKTLAEINGYTPQQFWAKYDAGEFKPIPVESADAWPRSHQSSTHITYQCYGLGTVNLFKIQTYVERLYEHSIKTMEY